MTHFSQPPNRALSRFSAIFLLIALFYLLWLVACWPGILGQDSLATMLEVDTLREFQAGKPPFWYFYASWLYGPWKLVEIPIVFQLTVCALVCARILSWMWEHNNFKSFFYCLLFVALAPSVVYYAGSFYSDGIYAIALAGMLFEIWRCSVNRRIDRVACAVLAITIPFAIFARPNGILNIAALLMLFWLLPKRGKFVLAALALPWFLLAGFAQHTYPNQTPIGSVFPLALYESVGFLEKRPMGLWEHNKPRITERTVKALTSTGASIEKISAYHDPYYWDPLIFFVEGPKLLSINNRDKKTIIREFFKYNLWHNFPAFASSRINIFLYSAFADGDFPGPTYAETIISQTKSGSEFKKYSFFTDEYLLNWLDFSMRNSVIFWTPWVGLFLILMGLLKTLRKFSVEIAVVAGTYGAQLAAVFIFSIAGEYRYLLAFFTAPLVLLPALSFSKKDRDV